MIECEGKVAVVILNWNGSEMMRRFLPSVLQGTKEDGEVIVADNGSTDDSLAMLSRDFPEVKVLPLHENYGFAEGYNKALAQVSAPYYMLLNSDVEVTDGWLAPMVAYMESHPETAACQPKLLSWRDRERFEYAGASGGFIDRYGYPFCRGRVFSVVERDCGQYDDVCPLFWATGAALMIRRADWEQSGGLDGRFFAHQEEIDLCWRLRARGRAIVCVPQSVAYHVGGATLDAGNPRKTYLNFRNNLLMLFKNLPEDELKPVMRVRRVLDGVAALKFLLTGDWRNFMAVRRARGEFSRIRQSYAGARRDNMRKFLNGGRGIPERISQSLLWLFYLKGCRRFSQIVLRKS